jgi:hypothetical protein
MSTANFLRRNVGNSGSIQKTTIYAQNVCQNDKLLWAFVGSVRKDKTIFNKTIFKHIKTKIFALYDNPEHRFGDSAFLITTTDLSSKPISSFVSYVTLECISGQCVTMLDIDNK